MSTKTYGEQTIEYIKRYMDELIDEKMYIEAEEIGLILCNIIRIYRRCGDVVSKKKIMEHRTPGRPEVSQYNTVEAYPIEHEQPTEPLGAAQCSTYPNNVGR